MKINKNIPGWNGEQILEVLADYAAKVSENGNILELGALFGRSTYVLGHNKHPSVKLSVIEIWPTIYLSNHKEVNFHDGKCGLAEEKLLMEKIKPNPDRLESQDFYELWKYWVGDVSNMSSVQGFTSAPNHDYSEQDLIFHDAGHSYEDVKRDLNHWFPKLKLHGIMIIDDYETTHFPDLCRAVDEFVQENDVITEMVTGRNILIKRRVS